MKLDHEQAVALGQRLRLQFSGQELIRVEDGDPPSARDPRSILCVLCLRGGGVFEYWRNNTFELWLDEETRLNFGGRELSALVSDYEEITRFMAASLQRLLRQKAQESKREKVNKLKEQAVVARVKQLAREDEFDFRSEGMQRALKLYIKLSERDCVELQVPFKDFEGVIPHLRGAIQSLRALYARGLRFSVRQITDSAPWVQHQSL